MTDYTAARVNMVESQIRPNRVTDIRILTAMIELPRERFVPDRLRGIAYVDEDIPLGNGRFVMEPMVLARLVQALDIGPDDRVLEIGVATGYDAALLSRLAKSVIALESDAGLARQADATLRDLGCGNTQVITGALHDGYRSGGPYNAILYGGATGDVPVSVTDQLADGGRLAAIIASSGRGGHATMITRVGNALTRRAIFDAGTPMLPGCEAVPGFAF